MTKSFSSHPCYHPTSCHVTSHVSRDASERTNERTNGLGLAARGSRVMFPNGEIDPWHALGVLHSMGPDLPALYVSGMGLIPSHLAWCLHDAAAPCTRGSRCRGLILRRLVSRMQGKGSIENDVTWKPRAGKRLQSKKTVHDLNSSSRYTYEIREA